MRYVLLFIATALSFMLAGCGSDDSDATTAPSCEDLSETVCEQTSGCGSVKGRPASDPNAPPEYVGCATKDGTPGSMIGCTAAGPDAPCWMVYQLSAPDGWSVWPCGEVTSDAECMTGAPF
jgi:hypothetical protein